MSKGRTTDDQVVLARIGKPHGLRGEVTVQLHTDDPESRFALGTVVDTQATPGTGVPRALTIRSTRVHQGVWLLGFEEIPDRTGAESLRGTLLVLDPDELDADEASDADDAYTEDELVGLVARDADGIVLGEISGLELGAAQDRLVITLTDGVTAYVPFVEQFVPTIAADHVVLTPPPGLLDLYREG